MGNKNCGCTPTIVVPVNEISGQGCCTPKQSCCSQSLPATPCAPASCLPACQEDHSKTYICNQFSASIKVATSWNVPDCGGSAVVQVSGLSNILIGSYIWTVEYGYYEVIGFNASTGQLTIQNNCNDGNAPVGTQVPGCVEFVVIDPPISSGGGGGQPSLFPYVAIDFTAPAVGDCLDITVTTVNGLAVGKNVQIGSGTYRLESIPSSTIIRICNDGDGIVPGTPVIAQNAQGQYQYPVILIDTNPCTNTPSSSGALIVCDGGVAKPLDGATVGSVPVLIDATTNEVEFQPLNAPTRTCTIITCCLTIVPGEDTYTIPVADSSQFTVGDILQIGTRTDRFTVTNIPDATHLTGTLSPVPGGSIVEIPVGTSICIVDCCELLQNEIDVINEEITDLETDINTIITSFSGSLPTPCSDYQNKSIVDSSPVVVFPANFNIGDGGLYPTSRSLDSNTFTQSNTSTCRNMIVTQNLAISLSLAYSIYNDVGGDDPSPESALFRISLQQSINAGPFVGIYTALEGATGVPVLEADVYRVFRHLVLPYSTLDLLAPGGSVSKVFRVLFEFQSASSVFDFLQITTSSVITLSGFRVAV